MTYTSMIYFFCYLLTSALAGLVVACVIDDIHIYDMFFCYLLTQATTNPARTPVNK
jgi:sugar phosphate permease